MLNTTFSFYDLINHQIMLGGQGASEKTAKLIYQSIEIKKT